METITAKWFNCGNNLQRTMMYIVSFIAGWVLGVVSMVIGGFSMYKILQEALGGVSEATGDTKTPKKRGLFRSVETAVGKLTRRPAVFVGNPTPKVIEKVKREEDGWGGFNSQIAKPASEEDDNDDN